MMEIIFSDSHYTYWERANQYGRTCMETGTREFISYGELCGAYRQDRGPVTRGKMRFAEMHKALTDCTDGIAGRRRMESLLRSWSAEDKRTYLHHLQREV